METQKSSFSTGPGYSYPSSGVSSPFFPSPLLRHGLALASLLCTPSPSPLLLAAVFRWIHAAIPTIFDRLRPAQSVRGVGVRGEFACGGTLVGAWGGGRSRRHRVEARYGCRATEASLPRVVPTHRRRTLHGGGIPLLRGSGSPTAVTSRPGIDLAWWRHRGSNLRLTRRGVGVEARGCLVRRRRHGSDLRHARDRAVVGIRGGARAPEARLARGFRSQAAYLASVEEDGGAEEVCVLLG